jgi:hypothetical protein
MPHLSAVLVIVGHCLFAVSVPQEDEQACSVIVHTEIAAEYTYRKKCATKRVSNNKRAMRRNIEDTHFITRLPLK